MIYHQKTMYSSINDEEEWGQFDDLEKYDIFEIQKVNVTCDDFKKNKNVTQDKKQNLTQDTIINIKNSFNSFCEVYNINIEFESVSTFCRFWSYLTVLTITVGLSSYFTKKELC